MPGLTQLRSRLQALRDDAATERQELLERIELQRGADTMLSASEQAEFNHLCGIIGDFDTRIREADEEIQRSGRHDPATMAIRQATSKLTVEGQQQRAGGPDARSRAQAWAAHAAGEIRAQLGGREGRAIISGSVDIPSLVLPQVVEIPWPTRIIDLIVNRSPSTYSLEYYVQQSRVNNAAPIPDLATKPTSQFVVKPVQDRTRVYAHLSDRLPLRIFQSIEPIVSWLANEMANGVTAAIEADAISGNGQGEHVLGVLNTPGVTAVPFATDAATTMRNALTQLQTLGEQPTAWVLNPADAALIDLQRWGNTGGLLTGGFENDTRNGFGTSNNIFGPSTIRRVVSPSMPQGTAVLADWADAMKLFLASNMMIVANAFGDSLFESNAVLLRGEQLAFPAVTRPQAFAVCDLTAGSG